MSRERDTMAFHEKANVISHNQLVMTTQLLASNMAL